MTGSNFREEKKLGAGRPIWEGCQQFLGKWSPTKIHCTEDRHRWVKKSTIKKNWLKHADKWLGGYDDEEEEPRMKPMCPAWKIQWMGESLSAPLSFTISWSLLKLMSIESLMPSIHPILCHALLLLPSVSPSTRVFSSESALGISWPEYWSLSFSISPSYEYWGQYVSWDN